MFVDIPIPKNHGGAAPIKARLISAVKRKGMIGERSNSQRSTIYPASRGLLFHCHGGGFVAQSSKSHESYLREWAVTLNVPILSIDYSLAPEAPFPRALEEVFYAYCWALRNCELLGTTGERVILAGDSAGANLNLGCAMKAIELGIRRPDGIFIAYCPVLISFENRKRHEQRQAIVNAGQQMRNNNVAVMVPSSERKDEQDKTPDRSDSGDDNSMWEQLNSANTVQLQNQHLSPVSDTASDTLALKSQSLGNTIDIISPDESNTITSLEEDSQPITLQQVNLNTERSNVTVVDDLDMDMPSDISSEQNTNQNVSNFINSYVLDTTTNAAGELEPILRPVSRSQSEENIVLDIGR
uniref:Alpha/beta hydrolase fold-3 domain-containing protein n=1 Tax=Anopheles maculatus TaxID=74869 RepID=A0A182SLR5_9DIPT